MFILFLKNECKWSFHLKGCIHFTTTRTELRTLLNNRTLQKLKMTNENKTQTFALLKHRRYLADILPIRRKTLYNQSINQSLLKQSHSNVNCITVSQL